MKNDGGNKPNVQYSMDDGATWNALPERDTIVLKKKSDKVLLRGNNPEGFSRSNYEITRFEIYSPIAASGSVMSLIDNTGESKTIPESSSYCFSSLFSLSAGLTQAPELPATTLADRCYLAMFSECTGLTQTPELPATTLAEGCYMDMFNGCTGLTQAPELPATTLADMCYRDMFSGCTGLTQAPELPATTLANGCYYSMFRDCEGLTQAPALPATTLAKECYCEMFINCSGLTQGPDLPALTLVPGCYQYMFLGCISLAKAPEILATSLSSNSCKQMFSGCTSLSEVTVHFPEWNGATLQWLSDVSATGTFTCPRTLIEQYEFGASAIPFGWVVRCLNEEEGNPINYLTFTAEEDSSSFGLISGNDKWEYFSVSCYYSLDDGATWNTLKTNDLVVLAKKGDKALLRGHNPGGLTEFIPELTGTIDLQPDTVLDEFNSDVFHNLMYSNFVMTGSIAASGSVMSLIDNIGIGKRIPAYCCFARLFKDCTSLTQAPELPGTTLANGCYCEMFSGCTNLKNAPVLPATKVNYKCYAGMFSGCSSLAQAPVLPADSLDEECYYGMFADCTSLTQAPALPAKEYARGCYQYMFKGCSNLSQIEVGFSEWSEDEYGTATDTWVEGVAPTGTFICPKELPEEYGVSRIPESWRVVFTNEPRGGKDVVSGSFFTWTENLTICVRGVDGLVEVYNLNGQLLRTAQASASETLNFTMPSEGVYVVKTATGSVKVEL